MIRMTKEEAVALEIERRSLLVTVRELSKGCDCRMRIDLDEFLTTLENKARAIKEILDNRVVEE